ncbi:ZYRO0B10472p [Zygosaccharomyces rouxii]|uniref:ZYRO0B10472p n=1 Tax=Zygosaccharomyces rouxii (strain ATCC 2623 / CBS 732 / NBRC 1130 / NCYC 568 / NRRL Y-229) TaxID=559307 RepID=C5DRR0_ZYGRC|nr:uncharacterized protein ZYRO0B10472g [Zygosaccharomyces rouxii]KAH9199994.1 Alpha/Beta hydrolase protein [Zygosaccharomyces rouxii]CAR26471.1 ZYRO0B10472p [Zygosaccharomyces rouxii]
MLRILIDIYYKLISGIILNCFLTAVAILALWHNFVTVHFRRRHDYRDTRSSRTHIKRPTSTTSGGGSRAHRSGSISSSSPLNDEGNLEEDPENNIEFDHTITSFETRPDEARTFNECNYEGKPTKELEDNPFQDILAAEDLKLVPNLKYYYAQYGIAIEEFEVETDDGFILDLWHLKHDDEKSLHPVLMLHGLLQSSGSFASSGRKSLAYFMHQSGFDIWLGNNRCGLKPKWNKSKFKNDKRRKWDWDIHEMVKFDMKALVNTVLEKTQYEKLTLIAHSQGTTQGFYGLTNGEVLYGDDEFRLADKLENFVALSPACYPGPLIFEKSFIKFMSLGIDHKWCFGNKSFLPMMLFAKKITKGVVIIPFMSYIMFNYLFDWNDSLWDRPLRDRHFLFSPVYISNKLMQWWLSPSKHKVSFKNGADIMFPPDKTWLPVENGAPVEKPVKPHLNSTRQNVSDFPHIMMFIPRQDRLINGEKLINHFIQHESHSLFKIWYIDEYSHLDVLWAHDTIERIGRPLVANLRLPKVSNKEATIEQ